MCGIVGLLGDGVPRDSLVRVEAAARRLHHRGPDAQGCVQLQNDFGALGHTRLSIIDLDPRSNQPFSSRSGSVQMVFNGEVYNFRELREELSRTGADFSTRSDTEVILRLYELAGAEGLRRLDGMFAFAIADSERRAVVLGRDRAGQKPLYYSYCGSGHRLALASEIKALRPLLGTGLSVDESTLPELLAFGYVPSPRSFFENVSKFPPGHFATWKPGEGLQLLSYWSPPKRRNRKHTPGDTRRQIRSTMASAVQKRLVADVPLGAFLSGGIDSSIVALEMVRSSSSEVRTYAASFPEERSFDESVRAREVANFLGTKHETIPVEVDGLALIERMAETFDEPFGDSSSLALFALARLTCERVKVVLTGDAGDELFAGYTRFLGGLYAHRMPELLAGLMNKVLSRFPRSRKYKSAQSLLARLVADSDRPFFERYLSWNSYFIGEDLSRLLQTAAARRRGVSLSEGWSVLSVQRDMLEGAEKEGADRLGSILFHNFSTYLLDDLLVKVDRATMQWGLEARSPFLDTALMELAFRLPSASLVRGTTLKAVLRDAYKDQLPTQVLSQRKHGFGVPIATWFNGNRGREFLGDYLLASTSRIGSWLPRSSMEGFVKEHLSGFRDHANRLYLLLQIEFVLRSNELT